MFRKLALISLALNFVSSSCTFSAPTKKTITGAVDLKGGALVQHPAGLSITIPAGGVYEDGSTLTVEASPKPAQAETGTFVLPDQSVFELSLSGDGAFAKPVEIEIPYDPNLLPDNRTETEVFAVFLMDETWMRMPGHVDVSRNVVRVDTVHNGKWSWAVDLLDNITGDTKEFICRYENDPAVLREAEDERQRRYATLERVLRETSLRMEEIEAPTDRVLDVFVAAETKFIIDQALEIARIRNWGGRNGILFIDGQRVGVWIGRMQKVSGVVGYVRAAMLLGEQAYDTGDAYAQYVQLWYAYQKYQEAETLVWALEHGCPANNMSADDAEALRDYLAALEISQTASSPGELTLDLSVSAYHDPMTLRTDLATPGPLEPIVEPDYSNLQYFQQQLAEAFLTDNAEVLRYMLADEVVAGYIGEAVTMSGEEFISWMESDEFTTCQTEFFEGQQEEQILDYFGMDENSELGVAFCEHELGPVPHFLEIERIGDRYYLTLAATDSCMVWEWASGESCPGPVPTDVDLDQFIPDEARLERAYYADLDANGLSEIVITAIEPWLSDESGELFLILVAYNQEDDLWEIKYQTSTQGQGDMVQQRFEIVDLDPGPSQQILWQYGINGTARRWPTILFLGWDGSRAMELFLERESFGSKGPNLKDQGFSLIYPQFADDDPLCCPSVCFLTDYRWRDDGFVEVASGRQEPCVGE